MFRFTSKPNERFATLIHKCKLVGVPFVVLFSGDGRPAVQLVQTGHSFYSISILCLWYTDSYITCIGCCPKPSLYRTQGMLHNHPEWFLNTKAVGSKWLILCSACLWCLIVHALVCDGCLVTVLH